MQPQYNPLLVHHQPPANTLQMMKQSNSFKVLFVLAIGSVAAVIILGCIVPAINCKYSCYSYYPYNAYQCRSGGKSYCCAYNFSYCGDYGYCYDKPYPTCMVLFIIMWVFSALALLTGLGTIYLYCQFKKKLVAASYFPNSGVTMNFQNQITVINRYPLPQGIYSDRL